VIELATRKAVFTAIIGTNYNIHPHNVQNLTLISLTGGHK